MKATSLKPKHVDALIALWREPDVSTGTLKNRLSALRWWAQKVNKQSTVARDYSAYGIGFRTYVVRYSKAQALDDYTLAKIEDTHVRMSVRLQAAFGLRREEAIKFQPPYHSMKGDHFQLKSSWTKGRWARTVPITNDDQRRLLDEATTNAGRSRLHGLRHGYAQRCYRELIGGNCPAAGGPASKELSPAQRVLDHRARVTISRELGHAREYITGVYLGR